VKNTFIYWSHYHFLFNTWSQQIFFSIKAGTRFFQISIATQDENKCFVFRLLFFVRLKTLRMSKIITTRSFIVFLVGWCGGHWVSLKTEVNQVWKVFVRKMIDCCVNVSFRLHFYCVFLCRRYWSNCFVRWTAT
jgi:hypothetical protein